MLVLRFVILASVLQQSSPSVFSPQRPWRERTSLLDECKQRLAQANDDAALLDVARFCESNGLFEPLLEVLDVLIEEGDSEEVRRLRREVREGDSFVPEELARFTEDAPAWSKLPLITAAQQKELLRRKDAAMKVLGSSGVFDLRSDLPGDVAAHYHKVFSGFYRTLKRRFPVWVGSKVDVLVFGNRADYLRFYRDRGGEGGENVLGFYSPSAKAVIFFDDPAERPKVENTARHECTHLVLDLHFDRRPLPLWLHEGMACYFAGECEQALGVDTAELFETAWEPLVAGQGVAFEPTLKRPREEFTYDDYATSWSWIHFLNTPRHEARFQEFLVEVKKLPFDEEKPDAYADSVTALLRETFPIPQLEAERDRYLLDEFALASPQQALDYARYVLLGRGYADVPQQERGADRALRALAAVSGSSDPAIAAEAAELRATALILRLYGLDLPFSDLRLPLRVVRDQLASLPASVPAVVRADLARRVLYDLQHRLRRKGAGHPTDLRELLIATWSGAPEEARPALRSIVATCDELLALAREAITATLAREPLHRQALQIALELGVAVAPAGLEDLFPRVKLLHEVEPDDRNLASLALCYLALGDRSFAEHLLDEAHQRSLDAASLREFDGWFKPD